MTNKVIMIRHGRSTGNEEKPMYGEPDSAICLTLLGVKQILYAGTNLKSLLDSGYFNWHWHDVHAFASGYTRAQQSSRVCLDKMGLHHVTPVIARGINERRYDKAITKDDEHLQDKDPFWRPGPNGETMVECRERFAFWFQHHAEYLLTDADILLFLHGEVEKAGIAHLLNLSNEEMMRVPSPNGVPFIFERDPVTKTYRPSEHQFKKFDPTVEDVIR